MSAYHRKSPKIEYICQQVEAKLKLAGVVTEDEHVHVYWEIKNGAAAQENKYALCPYVDSHER